MYYISSVVSLYTVYSCNVRYIVLYTGITHVSGLLLYGPPGAIRCYPILTNLYTAIILFSVYYIQFVYIHNMLCLTNIYITLYLIFNILYTIYNTLNTHCSPMYT